MAGEMVGDEVCPEPVSTILGVLSLLSNKNRDFHILAHLVGTFNTGKRLILWRFDVNSFQSGTGNNLISNRDSKNK